MSSSNIKPYHYIIFSGLGGCALANLLSARSINRVLLLEAEPIHRPVLNRSKLKKFNPFSYFNKDFK